MKKFAFILIGCFTALIISVAFIACDKKNNALNGGGNIDGGGSQSDYSLIGTWKMTIQGEGYYYDYGNSIVLLEIKADNTGKMTMWNESYSSEKSISIINWKYIYEDVIRVKVVSGYAGILGGQGEQMDLTVDWYGPNTVYFIPNDLDYSDYSFGPFIRQ